MTRLLFCGDPHGSENIRYGQELAGKLQCDAVIFLGDCYDVDIDYTNGPRVYLLLGNHEKRHLAPPSKGYTNTTVLPRDGSMLKIDNTTIAALGGIDLESHYHLKKEMKWLYDVIMDSGEDVACFNKEIVRKNLDNKQKPDLLITHDAPFPFYLPRGERAGSQFITELINDLQPKLHLGGHMHHFSQSTIGNTYSIQLADMKKDDTAAPFALLWEDGKILRYLPKDPNDY